MSMFNENVVDNAVELAQLKEAGTTADRPVSDLWAGRPYFDTTLGQPIWYDKANTQWSDSAGTAV